MRKSLVLMLVILAFVFGTMGTASAAPITTILEDSRVEMDLFPLFDENDDGIVLFGDGWAGISFNKNNYDFFGASSISQEFSLAHKPVSDGKFILSYSASDVDYSNFLKIKNSDGDLVLSTGINDGDHFVERDNSLLSFGPDSMNSIIFEIGGFLGNLDDFYINSLTLKYQYDSSSSDPSPAPEPSTMLLLGIGLLGAARLGRMKK